MDRRTTLADVAARAGVSTALVSIVMREVPGASAATRERVLAIADELGYRPDSRARLLRRSRSRLLGVVFGVQHAFHGDLVDGLYAAADRVGYEIALSAVTPSRDEERAVGSLLQDRCEALVLLGPQAPAAYLATLAARLPVVVVARPCGTGRWTSCAPTTRPGSSRPSTTSSSSGTGASRTSTAAGRPARPSAAAATPTRCTGTAWGATR